MLTREEIESIFQRVQKLIGKRGIFIAPHQVPDDAVKIPVTAVYPQIKRRQTVTAFIRRNDTRSLPRIALVLASRLDPSARPVKVKAKIATRNPRARHRFKDANFYL